MWYTVVVMQPWFGSRRRRCSAVTVDAAAFAGSTGKIPLQSLTKFWQVETFPLRQKFTVLLAHYSRVAPYVAYS